jgi:hypothetical protein
MSKTTPCTVIGIVVILLLSLVPSPAPAQNWPQFYDPVTIHTLNLSLSQQDWDAVRNDTTYDLEVPAQLWLTGESPVLVAVRRKSGVPVLASGLPNKVALKIDINQYVVQSWHGMKKLSLENGGDTSTLLEGFAWYLHRLAWIPQGYPYMPGLASWVRLYVNGQYFGIYVNVEQVDKRFLEQRGLWLSDDTWLYKQSDIGTPTIEFGPLTHSPTYNTLCYSPFPVRSCATPAPAAFAAQLSSLIDMQGMLTLGAVNAWCYSPDDLFSKGKNHYYSDSRYRKRLYYSWDMDANFGPLNANKSIYELGNDPYGDLIIDNPTFRTQYNGIMSALLNGPFSTANMTAALNSLEAVLLPAMSTDPYNPVTSSDFNSLRNYISARNVSVASQLAGGPSAVEEEPRRITFFTVHPNPANAKTAVEFHLERPAFVQVAVYDARGARVRTLVEDVRDPGIHHVEWEGTDVQGIPVAAGVYFISCNADKQVSSQKVVVLR